MCRPVNVLGMRFVFVLFCFGKVWKERSVE